MSDTHLPPKVAANLQRVLQAEDEKHVGQMAVDKGLISTHQLDEAMAQSGNVALKDFLLSNGWIRPSEFERLQQMQRTERLTPSAVPTDAQKAASLPDRLVDEYILVSMIGRGGMGEVWKAWDQRLDRWVAIKLSTPMPDSGMTLERFRREAVAAARLTHPNIVPIYRVAQQNDRPYIVMKWIEGTTLYKHQLSVRRAMEVIQDVARAVHYAHQQGVIHRDLKPGNIMIDTAGTVWVLDFGLAHLQENQRALTTAGTAVGTPAYMSPEQAKGLKGAKEPTTDVYSIGATLYEVLTGRPPFLGENVVDVVHKVCDEEPTQARILKPEIDLEVETILQKAMDKDRLRRYGSAFELAEDIRRYLNDEPILARPIGWSELVVRRLRKNPLVTGLAAAVFVSVVAVLIVWLAGRDTAREREAALKMIRETARGSTDMALSFRRKGNADVMGHSLQVLEKAYQQAIVVLPEQPEVEYLMGRMQRALMDDEAALQYQNRALKIDPHYAPSLYERIVINARFYAEGYETAMNSLESREMWTTESLTRDNVELAYPDLKAFREKIVADCRKLEPYYSQIGEAEVLTAKGLLALHTKNIEEGEASLQKAVESDPLREEAWEALAGIYQLRAETTKEESVKDSCWRKAIDCYTQANRHDRGYLPHYTGIAKVHYFIGYSKLRRGGDPLLNWATAEHWLNKGLDQQEGFQGARSMRASILCNRGSYKRSVGVDPEPDYAAAEKDAAVLLESHPKSTGVQLIVGDIRVGRGHHFMRTGRDPMPEWDFVEALFKEGDLSHWAVRQARGTVHLQRAIYKRDRGQDPIVDFEAAEKEFDVAYRIYPQNVRLLILRGRMRLELATHLFNVGKSPRDCFERAEDDFRHVLSLDKTHPRTSFYMGLLKTHGGIFATKLGQDPEPDWKAADEHYDRALKENPRYADAWYRRGQTWLNWGLYRAAMGLDPMPHWEKAEKYYLEAVAVDARQDEAWAGLGTLRVNRGSIRFGAGQDPQSDWKNAEADLKKSMEINPAWHEAWTSMGLLCLTRGHTLNERGGDPFPVWKQGEEILTKSIEINPGSSEARIVRGHLRHLRATEWSDGKADPLDEWKKAEADLGDAIRLDSKNVNAYLTRGQLRANRASFVKDLGQDPLPDWEGAENDFNDGLKVQPGHPKALSYRIAIRMNRGIYWIQQDKDPMPDWTSAISDLTELMKSDAQNAELYHMRGMIRANIGLFYSHADKDPLSSWAEAERDLNRAVQLNPSMYKLWVGRGTLYWMRATHLEGLDKPAAADFGRAAQDYSEAVRLNPGVASQFGDRIKQAKSKSASDQY